MSKKTAYFDHNATTPLRPAARDAMLVALTEGGNPSAIHGFGRVARKHIENARKIISDTLDVSAGQVFFNSGATEGNNTILKGFREKRVLISAIEHASSVDCGVATEKIPVTTDGVVDLDALRSMVAKGTPPALISVMMVNNETGVIQPVAEIAAIAKEVGALFHCDAVQAYGRIPFTRESIGADFITLSAHKIGGPSGVGAMVIAPNAPLPKLIEGGGQEKRMRGGTENVSGIAGFGAAAAEAINNVNGYQSLSLFRARIEEELMKSSKVKINGQNVQRVANTTSCVVDGISGDVLLMSMDIEGIGVSAGAACSSGSMKFSHVLQAMGVEGKADMSAIRISLGHTTTEDEVDHFIAVWNNLRARLLKD